MAVERQCCPRGKVGKSTIVLNDKQRYLFSWCEQHPVMVLRWMVDKMVEVAVFPGSTMVANSDLKTERLFTDGS